MAERMTTGRQSAWFRHRAWVPVAWLLSAVNVGAVWFAARTAEPFHATVHGALAVLLGLGASYLQARRRAVRGDDRLLDVLDQNEDLQDMVGDLQPRMAELEERLDFAERMLARRKDDAPARPGEGEAP